MEYLKVDCANLADVLSNIGIGIDGNVLQITFNEKQYNMKQLMSDLCDIFTYKIGKDTLLPSIILELLHPDDHDHDIQKLQQIYDAILHSGFITKRDLNTYNFIQILKISAFEVNPSLNPQEIEQIASKHQLTGKIYTDDAHEFMNNVQFGALFKSIKNWNQNQWKTIYDNIHKWTSENIHKLVNQISTENDIKTFCRLTNSDRDIALVCLQGAAWNVDLAVDEYFKEANILSQNHDAHLLRISAQLSKSRRAFIDEQLSKSGADRLWNILSVLGGIIVLVCVVLTTWSVISVVSIGSESDARIIILIIIPVAIVECVSLPIIYNGMKVYHYYYSIFGCVWIVLHIIGLICLTVTIPSTNIFIIPLLIIFVACLVVATIFTYTIEKARGAWIVWKNNNVDMKIHNNNVKKPSKINKESDIAAETVNMIEDVLRNVFVDGAKSHVFIDELMAMMSLYTIDINKEQLQSVMQILDAKGQICYRKLEQKIKPIDNDIYNNNIQAGDYSDANDDIINEGAPAHDNDIVYAINQTVVDENDDIINAINETAIDINEDDVIIDAVNQTFEGH